MNSRSIAAALLLIVSGGATALGQVSVYPAGGGTTTIPRGRALCLTTPASLDLLDGISHSVAGASEFALFSPAVFGSLANPMSKQTTAGQAGPFDVTVANPGPTPLTVTQVRLDAGANSVFDGIVAIAPTTGWTSTSTWVTWTGSLQVPAYSALDFVVQIGGAAGNHTSVPVTLTATTSAGVLTDSTHVTSVRNANALPTPNLPFIVAGAYVFSGTDANGGEVVTGQSQTYTIRVLEAQGGKEIPSGTRLTITMPPGWTSLADIASPGFNAAVVVQPTDCTPGSITTTTNVSINSNYRDFQFSATAPTNHGSIGIYVIRARLQNLADSPPIDTHTDFSQAVDPPPASGIQAGLSAVTPTVAVPSPMSRDRNSTWGVALANPSLSPITVTEVRIEATAGSQLFRAVTGIVPATGWARISPSLVRWTGAFVVPPREAANFMASIQANSQNITTPTPIRATVIDSLSTPYVNNNGSTTQAANQPSASLYYVSSNLPVLYVHGAISGQPRQFQLALEEKAGYDINPGATLDIVIPRGWSAVAAATQPGFTAPAVVQPTATTDGSVTATLSSALRSARRSFLFSAAPPPDLPPSLFSLPATLSGTQVNALCEGLVQAVAPTAGLEVTHLSAPVTDTAQNQIDFQLVGTATPSERTDIDFFNYSSAAWEPVSSVTFGAAPVTVLGSLRSGFADYFDPVTNGMMARVTTGALENHIVHEDYGVYIVSSYRMVPNSVAPPSVPQNTLNVPIEALRFEAGLGSVDLLSLQVLVTGNDPAGDVSLVHLRTDLNCNGALDVGDADLLAPLAVGPGNTVTFANGGSPILSFSSAMPACAILVYDIPVTATVDNLVGARIAGAFDLASGAGPYPFPSSTPYPIDSSDVLITLESIPLLVLDKTVAPSQPGYEVGTALTYTLTLTNNGGGDALNASVWDELDPAWAPYTGVITPLDGGSLCLPPACATPRVTWPAIGTLLRGGGMQSFRFQASVPMSLADGATLPNTASASADLVPELASNALTLDVTRPVLSLQKSVAPVQPSYLVGQPVTYSLTVTNSGGSDARNVDVWDDLDPAWAPYTGVVTPLDGGSLCLPPACSTPRVTWPTLATVAALGGSQTLRLQATPPLALADLSVVPNGGATSADLTAAVASNTVPLPVCAPVLSFNKSLPGSSYAEGTAIEWTMTVTNSGSCDASGVVVRDTIDIAILDEASLLWTPATGTWDSATRTYTWSALGALAANGGQAVYTVSGVIKFGNAGQSVCDTGRLTWDQGLAELASNGNTPTCATVVSGCAAVIPPVAVLEATKSASQSDVLLRWGAMVEALDGYNVWRGQAKGDIPSCRAPGNPPSIVAVCTAAASPACVDLNAVPASAGTTLFYQALGVCGGNEGQ